MKPTAAAPFLTLLLVVQLALASTVERGYPPPLDKVIDDFEFNENAEGHLQFHNSTAQDRRLNEALLPGNEEPQPLLQFTVKPPVCLVTPDALTFPNARHFIVECPSRVDDVEIQFIDRTETTHPYDGKVSSLLNERMAQPLKVFDAFGNRITSLKNYPTKNRVDTTDVKACLDYKKPETCEKYRVDIIRADDTRPELKSLWFSSSPFGAPLYNATSKSFSVKLKNFEPVTVTATAEQDFFVDFVHPELQRRAIEHSATKKYVPNGSVGGFDSFSVYVTNRDRSITQTFAVYVETTISTDARLARMSVWPGRMEPDFSPETFQYIARIPENSASTTLYLEGVNRRDTSCTVDGKGTYGTGDEVEIGPHSQMLEVHCVAKDGSHDARYVVHVVRQKGGTTLLKSLRVVGATDDSIRPVFDSSNRGPYYVDLHAHGSSDDKWVAFEAIPQNQRAVVEVEGLRVDSTSRISPFFQVRLGERKQFRVMVSTPENRVRETYYIDVDRVGRYSVENDRRTASYSSLLGWISTIVSSTNPVHFLHNANFLQFMSVTSRLNGLPGTYRTFAEGMNKFNLQFGKSASTSFHDNRKPLLMPGFNWTATSAFGDRGMLVNAVELEGTSTSSIANEQQQPTKGYFEELVEKIMHAVRGTSSLDNSDKDGTGHNLYPEYQRDPSGEATKKIVKRVLMGALGASDIEIQDHRIDGGNGKVANIMVSNLDRSAFHTFTQENTKRIMQEVDARYNEQLRIMDFSSSILTTTAIVAGVTVAYVVLWATMLNGNSASTPGFRSDLPSFLHPTRFWLFVLDYAFISYSQAVCGLSLLGRNMEVVMFGVTINPVLMISFAVLMTFAYPISFLATAWYVLTKIKGELVFAKSLQSHSDRAVAEVKAFRRWLKWMPIVNNFLTIEIAGVAPVQAVGGDSSPIVFEDDPYRPEALSYVTSKDAMSGEGGAEYTSLLSEGVNIPKYKHDEKLLRVELGVDNYDTRNYAKHNAEAVQKYGEAEVGRATYYVKNLYDVATKVSLDVQLQHLASLAACSQRYTFWVKRDGLDIQNMGRWHLLFGKAPRQVLMHWIIERCLIFSVIFFMNCWNDMSGLWQTLLFGLAFAVPMYVYAPTVSAGGASRWYVNFKNDIRKKKLEKERAALQKERLSIWPFDEYPAARNAYLARRNQKHSTHFFGVPSRFVHYIHGPMTSILNDVFWQSRVWCTILECVLGALGVAAVKSAVLLILFFGNRSLMNGSRNVFSSFIAIALCTIASVCINSESLKDFYQVLKDVYYESTILIRRGIIHISDLRIYLSRAEYWVQRWAATHSGQSGPVYNLVTSFTSRFLDVHEVAVVQSNLGLLMPGKMKPSTAQRVQAMEAEPVASFASSRHDPRFEKLLVTSGGLSCSRTDIDRSIPVQMSYSQFQSRGVEDSRTCVATVQIVNHGAYRFPHGDTTHNHPVHDSYLSLTADPVLMPEWGKIRNRHKYHGYSVRFERNAGEPQIVIMGPSIESGSDYQLYASGQLRAERPKTGAPQYSDSEESAVTATPKAVSHARVVEAGKLTVPVPRRKSPDLDELVEVDPPTKNPFDIDPTQIAVEYDRAGHVLHLRHRGFSTSTDTYRVSWQVRKYGSKPINLTGTAHQQGMVRFSWRHSGRPNLESLLVLRNVSTEKSVQVDPRDTDAHELLLPSHRLTGVAEFLYSVTSIVPRTYGWMVGKAVADEPLMEAVPCTVVQCVDPVGAVYRVEPNFKELTKKIRAEVEVLHAMKDEINLPDTLGTVATSLMSQEDYVKFWHSHGVQVVCNGYWINPLTDTTHPNIRGKKKEIRQAESSLRIVVARRIEFKLNTLHELSARVKVWTTAYGNPELRLALASRDSMEWQGDEVGLKCNAHTLNSLKAEYEKAVDNFVFPLHLSALSIRRRTNMSTQWRHWRHTLTKWLVECEGASEESYAGGKSCLQNTVNQVMHALQHSLHKPDDLAGRRLKSCLHFVIDSRGVRGSDPEWMPDPLAGMLAYCRVWRTITDQNEHADFHRSPYWMQCFLKLDGDRIVITLPEKASRSKDSPYFWKSFKGWHIPLRAFESVAVSTDANIPSGASGPRLRGMTTKVVFYKAQRTPVADGYALRLRDDKVDNLISTSDETYRLMIAHTVHPERAATYTDAEFGHAQNPQDDVNCFPLQFRLPGGSYHAWSATVKNAQMNRPPRQVRHLYNPEGSDSESSDEEAVYMPTVAQGDTARSASELSSDTSVPQYAKKTRPERRESSELSSFSSSSSADSADERIGRAPSDATSEKVHSIFSSSESDVAATPDRSVQASKSKGYAASPAKGTYRGDWKNQRFDGWGKLHDHDGKLVYDGQWKNGKRWGRGTCMFYDRRGIEWMYDGFFIDDEMCGGGLGGRRPGVLRLVDEKEIDRLKSSSAKEDRQTIVSFEGTFRLPRRAKRSKSAELNRDQLLFKADAMKRLFKEDKEMGPEAEKHFLRTGEDVVEPDYAVQHSAYHLDTDTTSSLSDLSSQDRARIRHKKKIIFDFRRTLSSPGDDMVVGRPLETIDPLIEKEGMDRGGAPRKDSLDSSDSTLSREDLDGADLVVVEDEYLPHRSKWTRLVDPTLGYWGLPKRFRFGTVNFADGSKYHGTLRHGKLSGKGYYQCFVTGCEVRVKGEWRDGKPNGRVVVTKGQDHYWGEMKEGRRHGKGMFIGRNGRIHFKGVFKDDKLDSGPVVANIDNSIMREYPYKRYVGQMENGLPEGHGKMTWGDGVVYRGKFKAGKRSGYGTIIDKEGNRAYVGQWREDMPHGRVARMILPDGKIYTGEMARGQRQGLGELFKSASDPKVIYEGLWRNDLPEGSGISYSSDGKYEGDWKHGKRSGKGKFEYKDSPASTGPRVYKGDWLNDFPHGNGRYLDSNGTDGLLKWDNGSVTDASLKSAKRKGLASVAKPSATSINSHDPNHWGRRRKIEPENIAELHATGIDAWTKHAKKPFGFVSVGVTQPFSDPPELIPPKDEAWEVSSQESQHSSN